MRARGSLGRNPGGSGRGARLPQKIFARRRKAIVLPPLHTKPVEGFDENRLDILLDKVRVSGYASLSAAEKKELNELSNKIK